MEKILVTGGAGYLGSVLVPALLAEGHSVRVLDNRYFKQTSLLDVCHHPEFEFMNGDAREEPALKKALEGVTTIIPLAALVGVPLCDRDPVGARTTNQGAIELLVRCASRDQKLIYPTSDSGYGIGEEHRFCTETSPLNPISLYARTKVAAEETVLARGNAISFRLATVFGVSPRMRIDLLVNAFVYRAVKERAIVVFEGRFRRNFIHVRDVARAFIHGIGNFERMKNECFNVGRSDANLSKLQLCAEIKKQVPDLVFIEAPSGEDPDKRDYVISNEKIERTGFRAERSIQDGVTELIKAYQILSNEKFGNV